MKVPILALRMQVALILLSRDFQNLVRGIRASMVFCLALCMGAFAFPNEAETKADLGAMQNRAVLNIYHALALDSNLNPGELPRRFGWVVDNYRYENAIDRLDFRFFGDTRVGEMRFEGVASLNKHTLHISSSMPPLPFCLRTYDVLDVFGHKYQPTIVLYENAPNDRALSDEVKTNMKLFSYGPRYSFGSDSSVTSVTIYFDFSACVQSITLIRESAKK